MRKFLPLGLCILLLMVVFAGCAGEQQPSSSAEDEPEVDSNWPVTVGSVSVQSQPERVLSLSPSLTEILYALGLQEGLIGRSDYCDYPLEVEGLPTAGTAAAPDIRFIIALSPQYILTQSPLAQMDLKKLEEAGIEVILLPRAESLEGVYDLYRQLFLFFQGAEDGVAAGEKYVEGFRGEIEALAADIPTVDMAYSVLYYVGVQNAGATPDTFEGELLQLLKLQNVAQARDWYYDFELLAEDDPDYIIAASNVVIDELADEETFASLKAVELGHVISVNHIAFERQSPRILLELKGIADRIYRMEVDGDSD